MLEAEMKILTAEINTQRDALRRAAMKVEKAQGSTAMQGMDLQGVDSKEIRDVLQRTDPSKV